MDMSNISGFGVCVGQVVFYIMLLINVFASIRMRWDWPSHAKADTSGLCCLQLFCGQFLEHTGMINLLRDEACSGSVLFLVQSSEE